MSKQTVTSPFHPAPLSDEFKGLASFGYNPPAPERARTIIHGSLKSGKTSFVCSNPTTCVLDFEGGTSAVLNPRAWVIDLSPEAGSVEQRLDQTLRALEKEAKQKKPTFTTVAVDSVDYLIAHLERVFCARQGVEDIGEFRQKGAGYPKVRRMMMDILNRISDAGYGIQLVSHLVEKSYVDDDGNTKYRYIPALYNSFLTELGAWIFQCLTIITASRLVYPTRTITAPDGTKREVEIRTNPTTVQEVTLQTVPLRDNRQSGCRVHLPGRLVLPEADGFAVYAEAYNKEVAQNKARLGIE